MTETTATDAATDATVRNARTLLLSLRPRFADAILAGAKTVELRRRPINARPGTPILLYASRPIMAIVGTARLREVQILAPYDAWQAHRRRLSLSRAEFDAYLDGSPYAYLLLLYRPCILDEPLYLHQLRREGQFRPPQSFRYVSPSDPAPLHGLVPRRGWGDRGETEHPKTVPNRVARRSTPPGSLPARTTPSRITRHSPTWMAADS